MEGLFYWLVTGVALVGVVLNLYKRRECFYIWGISNSVFAVESYLAGVWNMAFLFSIYFALALWGIYTWRGD